MGKGRIVLAFALLSFGARLDAAVEESPFRATSSAPAVAVSTEDFIPLLAPVASPRPVSSRADTISHGRLRLAEVYQRDNAGSRHTISRVESGGSVERLYSGPWSLVWLGNASYRDSNVFSGSSDFRKPRLHLMTLQLSRKIDGGGFARLGRILPLELPGIGYIDGAQLQSRPREGVSVGAAAGLRPNLADLGLSARQSLASAYATVEKGARGQWYYSGTLGVLGTEFKGRADELALLYDQRSDLSPKLSIYGTAQLDYKAWNGPEPKGVRLTRANATATSPLLSFFTLRTGLDHYERPQTRAEFDFSGSTATPFTNYSYSRYWVGAEQPLIWTLQLAEDVSRLEATGGSDQTLWRVTLRQMGFLDLPDALWSLTGYNLNQAEGDGYGMLFSAMLPFAGRKAMASLTGGLKDSARPGEHKTIAVDDVAARLTWRFNRRWSADLGVRQVYQHRYESTVTDGALSYYW